MYHDNHRKLQPASTSNPSLEPLKSFLQKRIRAIMAKEWWDFIVNVNTLNSDHASLLYSLANLCPSFQFFLKSKEKELAYIIKKRPVVKPRIFSGSERAESVPEPIFPKQTPLPTRRNSATELVHILNELYPSETDDKFKRTKPYGPASKRKVQNELYPSETDDKFKRTKPYGPASKRKVQSPNKKNVNSDIATELMKKKNVNINGRTPLLTRLLADESQKENAHVPNIKSTINAKSHPLPMPILLETEDFPKPVLTSSNYDMNRNKLNSNLKKVKKIIKVKKKRYFISNSNPDVKNRLKYILEDETPELSFKLIKKYRIKKCSIQLTRLTDNDLNRYARQSQEESLLIDTPAQDRTSNTPPSKVPQLENATKPVEECNNVKKEDCTNNAPKVKECNNVKKEDCTNNDTKPVEECNNVKKEDCTNNATKPVEECNNVKKEDCTNSATKPVEECNNVKEENCTSVATKPVEECNNVKKENCTSVVTKPLESNNLKKENCTSVATKPLEESNNLKKENCISIATKPVEECNNVKKENCTSVATKPLEESNNLKKENCTSDATKPVEECSNNVKKENCTSVATKPLEESNNLKKENCTSVATKPLEESNNMKKENYSNNANKPNDESNNLKKENFTNNASTKSIESKNLKKENYTQSIIPAQLKSEVDIEIQEKTASLKLKLRENFNNLQLNSKHLKSVYCHGGIVPLGKVKINDKITDLKSSKHFLTLKEKKDTGDNSLKLKDKDSKIQVGEVCNIKLKDKDSKIQIGEEGAESKGNKICLSVTKSPKKTVPENRTQIDSLESINQACSSIEAEISDTLENKHSKYSNIISQPETDNSKEDISPRLPLETDNSKGDISHRLPEVTGKCIEEVANESSNSHIAIISKNNSVSDSTNTNNIITHVDANNCIDKTVELVQGNIDNSDAFVKFDSVKSEKAEIGTSNEGKLVGNQDNKSSVHSAEKTEVIKNSDNDTLIIYENEPLMGDGEVSKNNVERDRCITEDKEEIEPLAKRPRIEVNLTEMKLEITKSIVESENEIRVCKVCKKTFESLEFWNSHFDNNVPKCTPNLKMTWDSPEIPLLN